MLWGLLDEQRLTGLQLVDTTIYFVAMIATVVLWARYVVSYLDRKNFFERWLLRTGQAIFWVFLVFIAINFFYPVFFWFDNQSEYHTACMRHAALVAQIAMFLSTSIYTLYTTAKTQGDIRQRHLAIGLLGLIGLNCIAMNDADLSQTTRELLQKIGTSAQHMLGVNNDILDISRIESGGMSLKNAEFSFVQELEQNSLQAGLNAHLSKPVEPDVLFETLEELL